MPIYLKREADGSVSACDDENTLNTLFGGKYDATVSEEDWLKNYGLARYDENTGKFILGYTEAELKPMWEEKIRSLRKRRLKKCYKISPMWWEVMSDEKKQEWRDYRQALLDIPQQEGFPWDGDEDKVPWPKAPE